MPSLCSDTMRPTPRPSRGPRADRESVQAVATTPRNSLAASSESGMGEALHASAEMDWTIDSNASGMSALLVGLNRCGAVLARTERRAGSEDPRFGIVLAGGCHGEGKVKRG